MLIKILQCLPPRTRRVLRMVCQRWNQIICQNYTLAKEEKIIFLNGYDLASVIPFFKFDHRRILNLHFIDNSLKWTDIEIFFWKTYGERVESIYLDDGVFNFSDLKRVIDFCPNLQSIKLQCNATLQEWMTNFDAFAKTNFIAPSVTTFHFLLHCPHRYLLTNYKLDKILAMFPNLTDLKLKFKYDLPQELINENLVLSSDKNLSIYGVLHVLCGIAKNLKKLHLEALEGFHNCIDVTPLLSELENIEELTLIPSMSFVGVNFVRPYAPLLKLTKLTSLNLSMNSFGFNRSVAEFIPLVLQEFIHLRHLYFNVIYTLELNEVLIESLISSALKTLSLSFKSFVLSTNVHLYSSSRINRNLETISIRSTYVNPNPEAAVYLFSILPRYFKNVNDLTVSFPNDAILQHIFKYQERLKKLRLEFCTHCTDRGFTGLSDSVTTEELITNCISELSNLEFLHIDPANQITEKTFAYFVFPKLQTLELENFGHSEMSLYLFQNPMPYVTKFEFLAEYSQSLEVLKLEFSLFVSQEELEEILRPFKQLRYVEISEDSSVPLNWQLQADGKSTYNYSRFFYTCPLLRKFVHNKAHYHINILTKNLVIRPYVEMVQLPDATPDPDNILTRNSLLLDFN